ncbi:hypothetical protein ACTZWW_04355 [Salinarimonas sp. NSM]|uniref:hypothetical protein n=1 Tax=Salinarimonas sp. NSM TaxID=3458003 RepID=UPI004035D703
MHAPGLSPRSALAENTAALCATHGREHGRYLDLSPEARASRVPLYAERDAITATIAADRAERREREREEA